MKPLLFLLCVTPLLLRTFPARLPSRFFYPRPFLGGPRLITDTTRGETTSRAPVSFDACLGLSARANHFIGKAVVTYIDLPPSLSKSVMYLPFMRALAPHLTSASRFFCSGWGADRFR